MTSFYIRRQVLTVGQLAQMRYELRMDPIYQRGGGIWTRERQQLFIDSLLNGFDVPPIYLHRLNPPELASGRTFQYAVIDGRQRLEAIWDFLDDKYGLATDFRFLPEQGVDGLVEDDDDGFLASPYGNLRFSAFASMPRFYHRFFDYELAVTVVDSHHIALIEELFFRLNEGVPLTPAEKRNRGELLREMVEPIVSDENVFRVVRFPHRRRYYEDLLLRLLYLEHASVSLDDVPDMKKRQLDNFANSFREKLGETWDESQQNDARRRLGRLVDRVMPVLDEMNAIFLTGDPLLPTVTQFIVSFIVIREMFGRGQALPSRDRFEEFEEGISQLRGLPERSLTDEQLQIMEVAQPIQGSTTGSYFRDRARIMFRFFAGDFSFDTLPPHLWARDAGLDNNA